MDAPQVASRWCDQTGIRTQSVSLSGACSIPPNYLAGWEETIPNILLLPNKCLPISATKRHSCNTTCCYDCAVLPLPLVIECAPTAYALCRNCSLKIFFSDCCSIFMKNFELLYLLAICMESLPSIVRKFTSGKKRLQGC